ncbi:nucleoside triphosphate hydrolase [Thalassospira sp.]|uniref:nucleoside triphosphate hydrolase n=1 Tax=Thalassospira sp. TaxID=1912094 RepID=UPI001B24757F|nr:nucleoside triphosphate hydrolase [Thalassospira sp.]MBO6805862.1 nucleoside triphosphate hydrolase [Thalassospira sp.]MBO6842576.1 nucleoside triphosphate hydrolase [Thalassospira sp.]
MTPDLDALADAIRAKHADKGRILVAIVGAPASGKSTLSDRLYHHLGGDKAGAAVVPMDGFHFDNAVLEERDLLERKGAPETFDVGGLKRTLVALRDTPNEDVYVPLFDRTLEISRGSARVITPNHTIILVEGNYLLLDQTPWNQLHTLLDLSIYLDVPQEKLRLRLMERWRSFGFDDEVARTKAERNDLPNAVTVARLSKLADIVVTGG